MSKFPTLRPNLDPHATAAALRAGDPTESLIAAVYEELRRFAWRAMAREPAQPTLQPTALVHEAYLRLRAEGAHGWASRAQFFEAAATAMRRILVERARRRASLRHGARLEPVPAEGPAAPSGEPGPELLELDGALEELRALDPALHALVDLRYFGGLSCEEAALVLGRSARTVRREWATARLFLFERIERRRNEAPRAG